MPASPERLRWPRRIVHVTPFLWSGAGGALVRLAEAQAAAGAEITVVTTGQSLTLTATLASGDYIDVDTAARTVLLNGTADRYSYLTTPQWWGIQPGANEIRYFADVTTASTATVTFRSAWV